ncbi:MAG: Trk system potassium transporter TrkA [Euryarchaeota archaeon]|nr:Trk system potassium transporter TrkA [Euryarchaeota archaeon]|tara:strand:+ start:13786 stop:15153 length:1368 start_codon:yes stop_codon:yes gene_type:complete
MKIVILGAGAVGSALAFLLSQDNDVVVVDSNKATLDKLEEKADVQTINGSCSFPNILVKAGIYNADMVTAVSGSDETNIVSCMISKILNKEIKTIARIREISYLKGKTLEALATDQIPVDVVVSPEGLITEQLQGLIELPGSLQVMEFGGGKLNLVAVRAVEGGPMIGHEIGDLKKHMPRVDSRVAAIFRDGQSIVPTGTTKIAANDEVFFISRNGEAPKVINEMRKKEEPYKNIIIAGGGKIGRRLAKRIERTHNVRVIESSHERAKHISENLESAIILEGDSCDKNLLHEENIENTDVFVAVTNDDEANVMSCLLAKEMGAHKVLALINNPAYVDLVQDRGIDIAISPSEITIGTFLAELEGKDVLKVHSLRKGAAEAIESLVLPSPTGREDCIGKEIGNIKLPKGATLGGLIRNKKGKIAHDNVHLREGDHVIVFLTDKKVIKEVKEIFSPK